MQFVADNVDHDICTLDSRNTFHGMGMIAAVTPTIHQTKKPVPRCKVLSDELVNCAKVPVHCHKLNNNVLAKINFEKLAVCHAQDTVANLDILWLSSWYLKQPRPGWNGTMQSVVIGDTSGKASVVFLPMIDLSPNDDSCLFSTLSFICTQASRHGITPVVTFDQPLWWKSMQIISAADRTSPLSSVVLKLGGFHILMSFLGCTV